MPVTCTNPNAHDAMHEMASSRRRRCELTPRLGDLRAIEKIIDIWNEHSTLLLSKYFFPCEYAHEPTMRVSSVRQSHERPTLKTPDAMLALTSKKDRPVAPHQPQDEILDVLLERVVVLFSETSSSRDDNTIVLFTDRISIAEAYIHLHPPQFA